MNNQSVSGIVSCFADGKQLDSGSLFLAVFAVGFGIAALFNFFGGFGISFGDWLRWRIAKRNRSYAAHMSIDLYDEGDSAYHRAQELDQIHSIHAK